MENVAARAPCDTEPRVFRITLKNKRKGDEKIQTRHSEELNELAHADGHELIK